MISHLKGTLAEAHPTHVVIDCGGVGYLAFIPLSSFGKLPESGQPIRLLTHLVVREDAHVLYGFATEQERQLFRLLVEKVNGVGPKMALGVLSGMNPENFQLAVASGDAKTLSKIPGIGKKTAERILVELKDKLPEMMGGGAGPAALPGGTLPSTGGDPRLNDSVMALAALGFKQTDAFVVVGKLLQEPAHSGATVEELVRAALQKLA